MPAVEVIGLNKSYLKIRAIEDINFSVEEGEIFGFIGPDGAGKSTLFRILTTLLLPDSGKATVLNFDVIKDYKIIRKKLGYMPGRFSLYMDLSVRENLEFFASIFGTTIEKNYHLIENIYSHLEPFENRKAGKLSGGMKQKLALSCALIHKPELLILDEPTTGVDAVSRKEFWEMLKNLKSLGITIIVSTPYMEEANLCDRVALIQKGKILAIDNPININNYFKNKLFEIKAVDVNDTNKLINALKKYEYTNNIYPFGEFLHYIDKRENFSNNEIFEYLNNAGIANIIFSEVKPNIEDTFIYLLMEGKVN